MLKKILIKGAKEHNLKNISLEIPKDKLVVITGRPIDIASKLDKKFHVSVENEWCTVDAMEDTLTIDKAIALLKQAKASGLPFYLGVGMHKPQ